VTAVTNTDGSKEKQVIEGLGALPQAKQDAICDEYRDGNLDIALDAVDCTSCGAGGCGSLLRNGVRGRDGSGRRSCKDHLHIARSRALSAVRTPLHNHATRARSTVSEIGTSRAPHLTRIAGSFARADGC
jgi:hypothetical protein